MSATGELIAQVDMQFRPGHVAWSPDGDLIAVTARFDSWSGGSTRGIAVIETTDWSISWQDSTMLAGGSIAVSPDGRLLAVASPPGGSTSASKALGTAIFGPIIRAVIRGLTGRRTTPPTPAVTPPGTVRLLELGSGELVRVIEGCAAWEMVFSPPGGELLAINDAEANRVRVISTGSGEQVLDAGAPSSQFLVPAFSPDGRWLATCDADHVRMIEVSDGHSPWRTGLAPAVRLIVDAEHVIALGESKGALLDARDGRILSEFRYPGVPFVIDRAIAVSPDHRIVLKSGMNQILTVDVQHDRVLNRLTAAASLAPCVDASPTDRGFAVNGGREAEGVLLLDGGSGEVIWEDTTTAVTAVAFSPDGKRLAVTSQRFLRIHDTGPPLGLGPWTQRAAWSRPTVNAVATTRGALRLVATAEFRNVAVWTVDGSHQYDRPHRGNVVAVAFDTTDDLFATGSADGLVRAFKLSGEEIAPNQTWRHGGAVNAVAFTPTGGIVSVGEDKAVKLFHPQRGEVWSWPHPHQARHVTVSRNGGLIATAARNLALTRDGHSGKELKTVECHADVSALLFTPDHAPILVVASGDAFVRLVEPHTGDELDRLAHDTAVRTATMSPSVPLLATADTGGVIRITDISNVPIRTIGKLRIDGAVTHLMFSATDPLLLAAVTTEPGIRLYDVSGKPQQLAWIPVDSPITDIATGTNPDQLISTHHDNSIRVYADLRRAD